MLKLIYDCFYGESKSEEYKARFKYLQTISSYELVEASLPVFVAAGIAGSAADIVAVLSEEKENMGIILTLLYALFMYIVGKIVSYQLLLDEESPSMSQFYSTLRKYKLSKLLRHSFAELSGFAWKEFFIILCLKETYKSDGFGASFGSWLLIIAVALSFIKLSSFVQRKLLNLDQVWNQKLLAFDTDAFALSIAYIFTVLLAVGGFEIGFGFIPSNQVIFEWNEDFNDEHKHSYSAGTPTTLMYTTLVGVLVALAQVEEEEEDFSDELCIVRESTDFTPAANNRPFSPNSLQNVENGGVLPLRPVVVSINSDGSDQSYTVNNPLGSNKSSFEYDNGSSVSAPGGVNAGNHRTAKPTVQRVLENFCDTDAAKYSSFLWNEVLGYTAGIAYFLLIFTLCDVNEEGVIKFISALLIALVVTYRGPPILAKLKITREEMLAKEEAKSRVLATGEPDTAGEGSGDKGVFYCTRLTTWISSLYSDMKLKRKSVMMVSIRLTVGWVWETVLSDAFALMGDTDELKPVERVLVEVAFAAVIILIVLCVHLYVRDWASDGLLEEQQRTQQQQRSAANSIDSTSAPQMSTITI